MLLRGDVIHNDTKPNGNILDFRGQKEAVDAAIKLFSGGQDDEKSRKIWLVEDAPVVIDKMQMAVKKLDAFMFSQGLENTPENVANLKGDAVRCGFVGLFKEVQRLKTQLDQYTDLTEDQCDQIETILPKNELQAFKGVYLDTASQLNEKTIRRTWHNDEWWFSVSDVVQALTDTVNPTDYIKKMRKRDETLSKGWGQIVTPLSIVTEGGKQRANCANTESIFRIIQSIPSPKAEPFKRWLAKVGYERVQEIENPELASQRARVIQSYFFVPKINARWENMILFIIQYKIKASRSSLLPNGDAIPILSLLYRSKVNKSTMKAAK